jgi:putative heme-binding domain-containing protein
VAHVRAIVLADEHPPEGRLAAVWVMGRIGGEEAIEALQTLCSRSNLREAPSRTAFIQGAALALGELRATAAASVLERLLKHSDAHVRRAAADALVTCGRTQSVAVILEALAHSNDPFLAHSLTRALHATATAADLRRALESEYPHVRKAALLLLDQEPFHGLSHADVLPMLLHSDSSVRSAASFCLGRHSEWGPQVADYLRNQLARPGDSQRDSLVLELSRAFSRATEVQQVMLDALGERRVEIVPVAVKLALLDLVREVASGMNRAHWEGVVTSLLRDESQEIRLKILRAAGTLPVNNSLLEVLEELVRDNEEAKDIRLEALAVVLRERPVIRDDSAALLLRQLAPTNAPLARLRAAEVIAAGRPPVALVSELIAVARREPLIPPHLVVEAARNSQLSGGELLSLIHYLRNSVQLGAAVVDRDFDWLRDAASEAPGALELLDELARQRPGAGASVLAGHESLLGGGDAARGRSVFFGGAACATCHRVGEEGGAIGPNLTHIGTIRSGRDLLESVLLPNASFAQGYETHEALLEDGDVIVGTLVRESADSISLRGASGVEMFVPREKVTTLTRSRLSLMPEGLLQSVSDEDIRDLLAYLQSLKYTRRLK